MVVWLVRHLKSTHRGSTFYFLPKILSVNHQTNRLYCDRLPYELLIWSYLMIIFKLLIRVGHPESSSDFENSWVVCLLHILLHSQSSQFLIEIHHIIEVKRVCKHHFMSTLNMQSCYVTAEHWKYQHWKWVSLWNDYLLIVNRFLAARKNIYMRAHWHQQCATDVMMWVME